VFWEKRFSQFEIQVLSGRFSLHVDRTKTWPYMALPAEEYRMQLHQYNNRQKAGQKKTLPSCDTLK
jgi:hypothetical protein